MEKEIVHLSDESLLCDIDGELPAQECKSFRAHLDTCWSCRVRRQELEGAISDFVHSYQEQLSEAGIPGGEGPRARLRAQLAVSPPATSRRLPFWLVAAACLALSFGLSLVLSNIWLQKSRADGLVIVSSPDSRLTPGAAVMVSRGQLCSQVAINNKAVPVSLKRKVLEEYGIRNGESNAYEVDYLITPALGGADDIHNLWPHSYAETVWNARVKDALEDRLRQMVCDGSLDLTTAQQEIASNWIATYKQYFHTDRPLQ